MILTDKNQIDRSILVATGIPVLPILLDNGETFRSPEFIYPNEDAYTTKVRMLLTADGNKRR
jgi:hypothetical protein